MGNKLIVVGQEAGGVGKTATTLMLAHFHSHRGTGFVVLDADDKHQTSDGSALAHALPDNRVIWLGTGPSLDEIEADPDKAAAHWDKVLDVLDHHSVLLDLGANTIQRLIEYALQMRVASRWAAAGIEIEVWIPTLSELSSLDAALKTLARVGEAFGKSAAIRCVRNHRDGSFASWTGTPQGKAMGALEKAGVTFVDLPKAPIPPDGLKAMRMGPWSPSQVLEMGIDGVKDGLGLASKGLAERTFFGCEDWLAETEQAWAGVLPPVTEGNA